MTDANLTVVRSGVPLPVPAPGELVIADELVRAWVLDGRILLRVQKYRVARLLTERLSTSGRPMLLWALWLMSRQCYVADSEGSRRDVTIALLVRWTAQYAREALLRKRLLERVEHEVDTLARAARGPVSATRQGSVLYLRTDLSFVVRAGGSVGHIAGVLNELARQAGPPIVLTTAVVPTLDPEIELHLVTVPEAFWNFRELPTLGLNEVFHDGALQALNGRRPSFVYQRYSLNNYAGLRLARRLGVPLVLEYNGSEIWMSQHWGRPLKYERLSSKIELLNLNHAELVVVVSRAMRDELVGRGVAPDRILVNPNGVDPDRYSPMVEGGSVRAAYHLEGRIVIGFISTFQPWHGAEVLAHAFVTLMHAHPTLGDAVHMLMIGSGPSLAEAKRIVAAGGLEANVHFTGLVAQEDGARHLAACDILASPHVPNPDGSPFFGSPTKLFEYMAMGKAIVASNLDQIGELLRHGETAWMVPPADPDALANGLASLVQDRHLRAALGGAARHDVVAHHTWRAHVSRILEALETRVHDHVA
ncbi:MAG: glycosyltransferase [Acidobacteriota bacterium]